MVQARWPPLQRLPLQDFRRCRSEASDLPNHSFATESRVLVTFVAKERLEIDWWPRTVLFTITHLLPFLPLALFCALSAPRKIFGDSGTRERRLSNPVALYSGTVLRTVTILFVPYFVVLSGSPGTCK